MKQRMHLLLTAATFTVATSFLMTCSSDKPTENTNHPPAAPANDTLLGSPSHSSISISRTPTLRWTCADPDGDALKYDVYLGNALTPPIVATRQTETSYSPDTLDYNTEYYWRVVAVDGDGASASSATWNFTTVVQPSETVSTPTTPTGPNSGETNQSLTFSTGGSISSFGHGIQYRFVWSVGDTSAWSSSTSASHSWANAGTYSVTAQARCAADSSVISNWSDAKTVTITAPPVCSVQPTTLDFGEVEVGSAKESSFTITNTGGGVLAGSVTESCSDFTIASGSGAYNLTEGQSVTVNVRFEPTAEGARSCTIETGAVCTSDVSCTGTGFQLPACSISTNSLDFGYVTLGESSPTQSFTITNTGGGSLNFFVSYTCFFDFQITSGGGARSLTAGQSVTVQVRFRPQSIGAKTCTLDLSSPYCGGITLTGTTVPPPYCNVVHTVLNFADRVGHCSSTQWFSVQNTGGGTLNGEVSANCADFEITSGAGPFSLPAGAITYVNVRFCPQTAGVKTCTIDLGTSCSENVSCSGFGTPW